jgi:hypothetical protein
MVSNTRDQRSCQPRSTLMHWWTGLRTYWTMKQSSQTRLVGANSNEGGLSTDTLLRCRLPQKFSRHSSDHRSSVIPCLCTYLQQPLWPHLRSGYRRYVHRIYPKRLSNNSVAQPTLIRATDTSSFSSTRYASTIIGCAPYSLTHVPQFDLIDKKELAPLDELNDAILAEDKAR